MANAWKRKQPTKILTPKTFLLFLLTSLLLLTFPYLASQTQTPAPKTLKTLHQNQIFERKIKPSDCYNSPQADPVIANIVEGLEYPFLYSPSDFGNLPEKPHKNIVRTLKGKPFRKPNISGTVQELLEKMKGEKGDKNGIFLDVGANVGMAALAAAVMGFKVLAFEPVFENLRRICEGIYFNRIGDLVEVFEAATSDSAVSATGTKMAFNSNEEIELQVKSILLDEVIQEYEAVLLLKIDVQGWEYHVLKAASKMLSRKKGEAPYQIYEEDGRLLQASNSSAKEMRDFLHIVGSPLSSMHSAWYRCTLHQNRMTS
ncbi:hypothetical protein ACH5RR_001270 [Cinchona calisaya]|uniref:Methyltransferase FkbM domain-containing protein n=1 Tax=Cinchona calisaya TaxID=153742 RepID=A0ABD3B453_9GENT